MGKPIGVWTMEDWHRIDNNASTILWLDHSIAAWCTSETQWHLNEYSAITMLNTQSLRRTLRGFCENNGLNTMLYKYMENDGTMKPQLRRSGTGLQIKNAVYKGQSIAMRVGTPPDTTTDLQVTSSVTILHSSISMTVGNNNDNQ
eukprot:1275932-Amphidinium_carterae.1